MRLLSLLADRLRAALDGAVRCVVAVDTQVQQVRCLAAGAHATLLKGWLDEAALRQAIAA